MKWEEKSAKSEIERRGQEGARVERTELKNRSRNQPGRFVQKWGVAVQSQAIDERARNRRRSTRVWWTGVTRRCERGRVSECEKKQARKRQGVRQASSVKRRQGWRYKKEAERSAATGGTRKSTRYSKQSSHLHERE